jgi:hypothetical protein
MPHPKAMYKNSSTGVNEKVAMSQEEEYALMDSGWFGHPEEARMIAVAQEEVADEKDELIATGNFLGLKLDKRMKVETMQQKINEANK